MKAIKTLFIITILFQSVSLFSKTAIIPYKIKNPAKDFNEKMSVEYTKLISITSYVKKGIDTYPHHQLKRELESLALNPKRLITIESLEMLGKCIHTDYIMLGTLAKTGEGYNSDSLIYSVRDNRIISRSSVKSYNIYNLAEKEVNDIFFNIPENEKPGERKFIDAAVLIDMSYKIEKDWPDIVTGIKGFATKISNNWSRDTRINLIPVSNNYRIEQKYLARSSNFSLAGALKKLKPQGGVNKDLLKKSMKFTVNDIPWRQKAQKIIIIITNSTLKDGAFLERYVIKARQKGISVHTISLGLLDYDTIENYRQLSVIGNGEHKSIAYHQRVYNAKGKEIDIFMESGRIFQSKIKDNKWQEGLLFSITKNTARNIASPVLYLDEIFYNKKNKKITPYNMLKHYTQLSGIRIISSEKIESNLVYQLNRIGEDSGNTITEKAIGKALITDGNISFWIQIINSGDFKFFSKRKSLKYKFPIGVKIQESKDAPYGIKLNQDFYLTDLPPGQIPDILRTSLKKIVENPDYYMSTGLFAPPLWFIDVKVERIESYKRVYDIRERSNP